MPAQRFRKNPVEVEAIQWTGDNAKEILDWQFAASREQKHLTSFRVVDPEDRLDDPDITAEVYDNLHSTWVGVKTGQWIICGVKGEFYPIDEEVLRETYTAIGGYVDGEVIKEFMTPNEIRNRRLD